MRFDNSGRTGWGRALWVLGLVAIAGPAAADGPEKFTSEHIAKLRAVTAVAISPDGQKVAYVLSVPRRPPAEDDGPAWAELHVVDRKGVSRPFVSGEVNVSDVAWMPDGSAIAFLAKRGKDEHKALYEIPVEGGEAKRVLSHGSDLAGFTLAPDGKRVAFLATEPAAKAKEELKKKGFNQIVVEEDVKPVKVWVASLGDSDAKPKALDLPGSASELRWSPAGPKLAVALAPTPSVDDNMMKRKVHVVDADSGKVVAVVENSGKLGKIGWMPDGKSLALISAADINDPAAGRLMGVPAEGGRPHDPFPESKQDAFPQSKGHTVDFGWLHDARGVILSDQGVKTTVWTTDGEFGFPATIPSGDTVLTALSVSRDGDAAAFVGQTPAHPGEVFVAKLGEEPKKLTDSNPWLSKMAFAKQEVIKYKARDGLEIEGILIRPLDIPEGRRVPLVLDVHGGPESHVRNGWNTGYSMPGQMLAAKGIAVFLPNYRGSTGRGVAFSKLGQGDPAGKEFDDLVDAVDHFIASGLADKDKIGVTGGSYGGYATAWCATRYSDRFAAGVMFVGISDKISKTGTTDIPEEEFLVHARRRPWDDWKALLEHSPIYHTGDAKTPLLIMHGKEDPRVFPGQSLELYRFLKIRGKAPVRLVLYPGEGHGNLRAASRLDYNLRMIQWFEHYLKGPGGPPPSAEMQYGSAPIETPKAAK